eukprot:NODE_1_length_95616_cov_0.657642.p21 type:complete len:376 gc:universal NODE_1_length_95616_cov_0.657642:43969-42842(-)
MIAFPGYGTPPLKRVILVFIFGVPHFALLLFTRCMNSNHFATGLRTRYNPCKSHGYLIRNASMEHLRITKVDCSLDLPLLYELAFENNHLNTLTVNGRMKCPGCQLPLKSFSNAKNHLQESYLGNGMLINLGVDAVLVILDYVQELSNFKCGKNQISGRTNKELHIHDIPFATMVNPVYQYSPNVHIQKSWAHVFENYRSNSNSPNFTCDPNALILHIYSVSMDTIFRQLLIPSLKPMNSFIFALLTCHVGSIVTELNLSKHFKMLLVDLYSKKIISEHDLDLYLTILAKVKLCVSNAPDLPFTLHTETIDPVPSNFHADTSNPVSIISGTRRLNNERTTVRKKQALKVENMLPKVMVVRPGNTKESVIRLKTIE